MGLINYKDIDFNKSIKKENKIITFNNSLIQITNYLSAKDKYDLIIITLQKSFENNLYNPFKMNMFFDLNVMYLYTNIIFSEEDRADEAALYDTLKQSGLIDIVKENIDAKELQYLKECILDMAQMILKYGNTFGYIIGNVTAQLPELIDRVKGIFSELDPESIKTVTGVLKEFMNKNNQETSVE